MSADWTTALAQAIATSYEGLGSKKLTQPETWLPEAKAAVRAVPMLIADELDHQAQDLYRRADNLPLSDAQQVQRLGDFREIADKLTTRAAELRGGSWPPQ